MRRAQDLIKYFSVDLAYFKDSYTLTEELVSRIRMITLMKKEALKVAVEECNTYLELNIKRLLDVGSKKHIKRFRDLLKVLESSMQNEAEYKRYLKMYVEARRSGFKGRLVSMSSSLDNQLEMLTLSANFDKESSGSIRMSILGGSLSSQTYERGSHPAIE